MKLLSILKIFLFVLFILNGLNTNAQVTINGSTKDDNITSVYLITDNKYIDSSTVKNGVFSFFYNDKSPLIATLRIRTIQRLLPERFPVYLHAGNIDLEINHGKVSIKNNQESSQFQSLWDKVKYANDQVSKFDNEYFLAKKDNKADTAEILKNRNSIRGASFRAATEFIKSNPNSLVSIEALKMMGKGSSSIKSATVKYKELASLFESLSSEIKNSSIGVKYAQFLAIYKSEL